MSAPGTYMPTDELQRFRSANVLDPIMKDFQDGLDQIGKPKPDPLDEILANFKTSLQQPVLDQPDAPANPAADLGYATPDSATQAPVVPAAPTDTAVVPAQAPPDVTPASGGGTSPNLDLNQPYTGPAQTGPTPLSAPTNPPTAPPAPVQGNWQDTALAQLNKPYIWGSKGGRSDFSVDAAGFDCSGFVSYVVKNGLGINLPALTGSAYEKTSAISLKDAKPGDVVFYNMDQGDPHVQHMALYLGDGKIVQAGGTRSNVNIASVYSNGIPEFRRPSGEGAASAQRAFSGIAPTVRTDPTLASPTSPTSDLMANFRAGLDTVGGKANDAKNQAGSSLDGIMANFRAGLDQIGQTKDAAMQGIANSPFGQNMSGMGEEAAKMGPGGILAGAAGMAVNAPLGTPEISGPEYQRVREAQKAQINAINPIDPGQLAGVPHELFNMIGDVASDPATWVLSGPISKVGTLSAEGTVQVAKSLAQKWSSIAPAVQAKIWPWLVKEGVVGEGWSTIQSAEDPNLTAQKAFDNSWMGPVTNIGLAGAGRLILPAARAIGRLLPKGEPTGEVRLGAGVSPEALGTTERPLTDRFFHGTGSAFDNADPGTFDPNGLYGPAYYATNDARVAGGVVNEFGLPRPPKEAPLDAHTKWHLAQQSEPGNRPGGVIEPGYAQNRITHTRSGDDIQREIESIQYNIKAFDTMIEEAHLFPNSAERLPLLREYRFNDLRDLASLQKELHDSAQATGPNVRPVDVPRDLNLFDVDQPIPDTARMQLADALDQQNPDLAARLRNTQHAVYGDDVYQNLQFTTYRDKTALNQFLAQQGYDGIRYSGGKRIPMRDEAGQAIEHTAVAIFPESIDKVRNAYAPQFAGAGVSPAQLAAQGLRTNASYAAAGAIAGSNPLDPNLTPEERRQGALQGATAAVAGRYALKSPAVRGVLDKIGMREEPLAGLNAGVTPGAFRDQNGILVPGEKPPTAPREILLPNGKLASTVSNEGGVNSVLRTNAGAEAAPPRINTEAERRLAAGVEGLDATQASFVRTMQDNPELAAKYQQGHIPNADTIKSAQAMLEDGRVSVESVLAEKPGTPHDPNELVAMHLLAAKQDEALRLQAQQMGSSGGWDKQTPEVREQYRKDAAAASRLMLAAEGAGSTAARTLQAESIKTTPGLLDNVQVKAKTDAIAKTIKTNTARADKAEPLAKRWDTLDTEQKAAVEEAQRVTQKVRLTKGESDVHEAAGRLVDANQRAGDAQGTRVIDGQTVGADHAARLRAGRDAIVAARDLDAANTRYLAELEAKRAAKEAAKEPVDPIEAAREKAIREQIATSQKAIKDWNDGKTSAENMLQAAQDQLDVLESQGTTKPTWTPELQKNLDAVMPADGNPGNPTEAIRLQKFKLELEGKPGKPSDLTDTGFAAEKIHAQIQAAFEKLKLFNALPLDGKEALYQESVAQRAAADMARKRAAVRGPEALLKALNDELTAEQKLFRFQRNEKITADVTARQLPGKRSEQAAAKGSSEWLKAQAKAAREEARKAQAEQDRLFDKEVQRRERGQAASAMILKKAGGEVTDEMAKLHFDLMESGDVLAAAKYVRAMTDPGWAGKATILRYASMMSATTTNLMQAVSNGVGLGTELATKGVAAGLDASLNPVTAAGSFLLHPMGKPMSDRFGLTGERTRYAGEVRVQALAQIAGLRPALADAADMMKSGVNVRDLNKDIPHAGFQSRVGKDFKLQADFTIAGKRFKGEAGVNDVVDTAIEEPLRTMQAGDIIFRGMSLNGNFAALAYRKAMQEAPRTVNLEARTMSSPTTLFTGPVQPGAQGMSRETMVAARAQDILMHLEDHPQLVAEAEKLARRTVFQEDRGSIANVWNDATGVSGLIKSVALPFTKTPINITAQALGWTPAGLLAVIKSAGEGISAGRKMSRFATGSAEWNAARGVVSESRGAAVDQAARAIMGTALTFVVAAPLAQAGMLTAWYPKDEAARSTLPDGWQPWSVKIGDKYISYATLGPLGLPLALGAAYNQASMEGLDPNPSEAVAAMGQYITGQTYLQSIDHLVRAMTNPDTAAENFIEQVVGPVVPDSARIRQISRSMGLPEKDPHGWEDALKAASLFGAQDVPNKQNRLGQPVSPSVSGIGTFIIPAKTTTENDNPTFKELRKYGVGIPAEQKAITKGDVTAKLEVPEWKSLQTAAGSKITQSITAYIQSPAYQKLTPNEKRDTLQRMVSQARTDAATNVLPDTTFRERMKASDPKDAALGAPTMPPKYHGVADPVDQFNIDQAIKAYTAWSTDRKQPRPTEEQEVLYRKYHGRITPEYEKEQKKMAAVGKETNSLVRSAPVP